MDMEQLINAYNNLDIEDKKVELADEFAEFLGLIQKLRKDVEINEPVNLNPIVKLHSKTASEDEYLTSIYENILNLKEELAIYLDKITDEFYE